MKGTGLTVKGFTSTCNINLQNYYIVTWTYFNILHVCDHNWSSKGKDFDWIMALFELTENFAARILTELWPILNLKSYIDL
jgi:hypothetical protein